jgi:hypothetical protein
MRMRRSKDKTELFQGADGLWRWRVQAANGQIIASSGESYSSKWNAKRAAKRVTKRQGVE